MLRSSLFILVLLLCASTVSGQGGRQKKQLYDLTNPNYNNKGWYFAPGMTYMLPTKFNWSDERMRTPDAGALDTLFTGDFNSRGKIGAYLEVGRHHFTDKILMIDNFDYGLAYKMFRGTEDFDGLMKLDSVVMPITNAGKFNESYISGHFNVSNIIQIQDRNFVMNSVGLNVDYKFFNSNTYPGPTTGMNIMYPNDLLVQLHYRLGFGFRLRQNLFVIPSIETPILNIVAFDDGKSTLQYFNSRYRPIIFSIRFLLLDKKKLVDCTGKGSGKTGHQLWDKKMGKKYRN